MRHRTPREIDVPSRHDTRPARVFMPFIAITRGEGPDGAPLFGAEKAEPLKLSKASLAAYDPATLARLRRLDAYRVEGGMDVDTAAALLGFSSGDELVRALLEAPPLKAAVQAETDKRMRAAHGDLMLDDAALREQAEQAVLDQRETVVRAELAALSKGLAGVAPLSGVLAPASVFKTAAETRLAQMRERDVRPGQFLMAAQRASREAFNLRESNRAGAVKAKQQELLSLALYRAALAAKDDAQKAVAHGKRLSTPAAQARLGKAGESYQDQVNGILARFELATVPLRSLDRRTALVKWVAAQEAEGLPVDLPDAVLDEAQRRNWRDLTIEDLRGIDDALTQIEHLARLKNRLLVAKDRRAFADVVTDIVTSIATHAPAARAKRIETRLPQDQAARVASIAFAAHRKLSNIVRELDGWRDGGVLWERIVRPLNAAADAETAMNAVAARALADAFTVYAGEERSLYQKTYIPAIGSSLSKMGRLMVALNWGNEGNRDRLVSDRVRGWNATQVQAILDTLDSRDVAFVNRIWSVVESYWPEIEAKQRRVFGVAPQKVEAVPFTAKGGAFTGGYFPIAYEGQLSARSQSNLDADFAESLKKASYVASTTKRGHTEARAQHYTEPLRLDFGVISEHLTQVVHDLAFHETLIDVGRLLGNAQVQDAVYAHGGDVLYDQMKGAVRDAAWGQAPAPNWLRPLNALRQGVVVARLGWSIVTTALQPFQSLQALPRLGGGVEGAKWLLRGYSRWMRNAATMESTTRWIRERSSFMRDRGLTQLREINEMRNRIGLDHGRVSGWMHDALVKLKVPPTAMSAVADSYFYTIQQGQKLADIPVWLAAYEKAMADPRNNEDRAVALADQAVRDTQGSGQIHDLAAVERQSALKFLSTFYSFQNLLLQQTIEATKRTDARSVRALGRLAIDAFVLLFAAQVIESQVRSVLSGGGADDDEPLVERLIRAGLAEFAGLFVGVRELEGVARGFDYSGPAGFQWVADVGRLGQQAAQGELDAAFWRSLNTAAGDFFHYPAAQIQRTAEGLQALMDGRTKNPLALAAGAPRDAR